MRGFRLPRRPQAYAAGAAILATANVVEPTSNKPASSFYAPPPAASSKSPLYSPPQTEIILVDTPSALELKIGEYRRLVTGYFNQGHSQVQGVISKWIAIEQRVESRVKSFRSPDETMTPQILYIAIATLSSTLLSANVSRFAPRRFLLPPLAFATASYYWLPKTSTNVYEYGREWETPRMREIHDTAVAHTKMSLDMVRDKWRNATGSVGSTVESGVGYAQGATGLKIREAMGWGKHTAEDAKQKAEVLVAETKDKAIEVKDKVIAETKDKAKEVKDKVVETAKPEKAPVEKKDEPPKRQV
ncbi:apolipo protein O-domain-containing protein [Flagelloscypha sp. PMI_526]|nr:apolipo protein O-domain-containing protein [Flagelloscypha sp. PMI_526]